LRQRKQPFSISKFYCTQCGREGIPIPRKDGRNREPGHLKRLYCINCKKEHNFVEVKPFGKYSYEDFQKEFNEKNFTEEGERIKPWKSSLY
jgi:hypothetical protein